MSTEVISESAVVMNTAEAGKLSAAATIEVDCAKCDCCGLTEECTLAYIETIRELYQGKWICGLCAEAVKDEMLRCERLINAEEALSRHLNFCKKFSSSSPPVDPTVHLIAAMRQLLRRSLDSPKSLRSMPCSPSRNSREMQPNVLVRAESCIPTISLVESAAYHAMEMDGDSECNEDGNF
ncbi:putative protein isoform X2 [Capsicum chacoense]